MARFLRWTLLVVVVLTGAWFYFAPRRAYDRFIQAVAFGNEAELEATVDFPVLRMNLREDLRKGIEARARTGIGATAAIAMLGGLVDAAVTPEGLSQIVTQFGTRRPGPDAADSLTGKTVTAYRYRAPSQVDVVLYPEGRTADAGGILTFTRSGLTWKLTRAWSPRQTTGRER
jgi:hypothetical protein